MNFLFKLNLVLGLVFSINQVSPMQQIVPLDNHSERVVRENIVNESDIIVSLLKANNIIYKVIHNEPNGKYIGDYQLQAASFFEGADGNNVSEINIEAELIESENEKKIILNIYNDRFVEITKEDFYKLLDDQTLKAEWFINLDGEEKELGTGFVSTFVSSLWFFSLVSSAAAALSKEDSKRYQGYKKYCNSVGSNCLEGTYDL